MKKILILFLIFLPIPVILASDFADIDAHALNAPPNIKSVKELSSYLTEVHSFTTKDQVRSIHTWITHNIAYDVKQFAARSLNSDTPEEILEKRITTCNGYARLFKALCDSSGIKCVTIAGYDKGVSYKPGKNYIKAEHLWNAVQIDGNWYLVDPTWDSGVFYKDGKTWDKILSGITGKPYLKTKLFFEQKPNDHYFLVDPEQFVLDHVPADPTWQLLEYPVPIDTFEKSEACIKTYLDAPNQKKTYFNFTDTIEDLFLLPVEMQEIRSSERAMQYNPDNLLIHGLALSNRGRYYFYLANTVVQESKKYKTDLYKKTQNDLDDANEIISDFSAIHQKDYKNNMDLVKTYSKEVQKEISSYIKLNEKNLQKNIDYIKDFSDKKKDLNNKIAQINEDNIILNLDDDIYYIERPDELPGVEDSMIIVENINQFLQNKDTIEIIQRGIDSMYSKKYKELYRSISERLLKIQTNLEKNYSILQNNLNYLMEYNPMFIYLIDKNRDTISMIKEINIGLRDYVREKEKTGFKGNYNIVKDQLKIMSVFVKENKKLLEEVKKNSYIDQNEEDWFMKENQNMMEENFFVIAQFFEEMEFIKSEIPLLKQENKMLALENKVLNKQLKLLEQSYEYERNQIKLTYTNERNKYKQLQKQNKSMILQSKKSIKALAKE